MKKNQVIIAVLAVAFVAFASNAFAKEVKGKVVSVDAATKAVKLTEEGSTTEVTVKAGDATQYTGVASLDELKAGADVTVEAEQDAATGDWKASSIKTVEAAAPAAPAAPAAS